jgi:putative endonuclease
MSGPKLTLGDAGERLAERHLRDLGWSVIERKWRVRGGEIDLVALDGNVLVFVEVKARRGNARGAAEEAVAEQKAARLLQLGERYVGEHPEHADRYWRVDLVAITIGPRGNVERVNHLQNACSTG